MFLNVKRTVHRRWLNPIPIGNRTRTRFSELVLRKSSIITTDIIFVWRIIAQKKRHHSFKKGGKYGETIQKTVPHWDGNNLLGE